MGGLQTTPGTPELSPYQTTGDKGIPGVGSSPVRPQRVSEEQGAAPWGV